MNKLNKKKTCASVAHFYSFFIVDNNITCAQWFLLSLSLTTRPDLRKKKQKLLLHTDFGNWPNVYHLILNIFFFCSSVFNSTVEWNMYGVSWKQLFSFIYVNLSFRFRGNWNFACVSCLFAVILNNFWIYSN